MGESIGLAIWSAVTYIVTLILRSVLGAYFGSASVIVLAVVIVAAIAILILWRRRAGRGARPRPSRISP